MLASRVEAPESPSLSKRATPKPHADEYISHRYIDIPRGVPVALFLTENLKFSGFQHVKAKAFRKRLLCIYIPPFHVPRRGCFLRETAQSYTLFYYVQQKYRLFSRWGTKKPSHVNGKAKAECFRYLLLNPKSYLPKIRN